MDELQTAEATAPLSLSDRQRKEKELELARTQLKLLQLRKAKKAQPTPQEPLPPLDLDQEVPPPEEKETFLPAGEFVNQFTSRFLPSAGEALTATKKGFTEPNIPDALLNLTKGAGKTLLGTAEFLTRKAVEGPVGQLLGLEVAEEQSEEEQIARGIGGKIVESAGTPQRFQRSLAQDPVPTMLNTALPFQLGGPGLIKGATLLKSTPKLAKATRKTGEFATRIGNTFDPATTTAKVIQAAVAARRPVNTLAKSILQIPLFSETAKALKKSNDMAEAFINSGFKLKFAHVEAIEKATKELMDGIRAIESKSVVDGIVLKTTHLAEPFDKLIELKMRWGLDADDVVLLKDLKKKFLAEHGETLTAPEVQAIKQKYGATFVTDSTKLYGNARKLARQGVRRQAMLALEGLFGKSFTRMNKRAGVMIEMGKLIAKALDKFEKRDFIGTRGLLAGAAGSLLASPLGFEGYMSALKFGLGSIIAEKVLTNPNNHAAVARLIRAMAKENLTLPSVINPKTVQPAFQAGQIPTEDRETRVPVGPPQGRNIFEILQNAVGPRRQGFGI